MIVPIDRVLNNGEIVEILTASASSGHGPSQDWLSVVKTGEAKNKIRLWFKRERRAENIQMGKNTVDAELKKAAPRLGGVPPAGAGDGGGAEERLHYRGRPV